jgi:tetratricopeptide (TPR) repeat protein
MRPGGWLGVRGSILRPLKRRPGFRPPWRPGVRRGHLQSAVDRFESAQSAFAAAGDQRRAAEVEVPRADIAVAQGHLKSGAARLRAAYEFMLGGELVEAAATVAAQLGRMLVLMDQYTEAQPYLETALAVAEELHLPAVFSQALNSKGIGLMHAERSQESNLLIRHALEVALQNELWPAAFRAFNNLGLGFYHTDRNRDGLELFAQALEHARRLGDRSEIARALSSQLGYLQHLGLWDEAIGVAGQCEEVAGQELLHTSWLVTRCWAPIAILCERGDLTEARNWADRLALSEETDQPDVALASVLIKAEILRAEGNDSQALNVLQEAQQKAKVGPTSPVGKAVWPLQMECALTVSDFAAADALLAPVLARKPGQTPPSLAGLRLRFKARLAAARGESGGVWQDWMAAAAIFRDAEMPFYQAVTQLELAEWLGSRSERAKSAELIDEALTIFRRLKAQPWVLRAERAAAASPVSAS